MLTAAALAGLRNYLKSQITSAKYKVGSTYYTATINDVTVLSDGRVSVSFTIDHTVAGNITVTEVQLYDRNGVLLASKTESINRAAAQEGILYRFRFTIAEN
ncbi:MAG: hypothetical protein LLF96_07440 [Eubacteriales bacterium]|nr:hypothetical protein [Eubacteriales bacterium]